MHYGNFESLYLSNRLRYPDKAKKDFNGMVSSIFWKSFNDIFSVVEYFSLHKYHWNMCASLIHLILYKIYSGKSCNHQTFQKIYRKFMYKEIRKRIIERMCLYATNLSFHPALITVFDSIYGSTNRELDLSGAMLILRCLFIIERNAFSFT